MNADKEGGLIDVMVCWKSRIQVWAAGSMAAPGAEGSYRSDLLIPVPLQPPHVLGSNLEDWAVTDGDGRRKPL